MHVINSIADLRELARRRIPRSIFEYVDRGSYDELTLARNRSDLDALLFRQRVLIDVARQSLSTQILGAPATMPLVIGPTGMAGLVHPRWRNPGGAGRRSLRHSVLPQHGVHLLDRGCARSATGAPFWFQLYVMRDRGYTAALVDRAEAAGCPVLMMTVDIPVSGLRRRDAKNGLSIPPRLTLRNAFNMACRPRWLLECTAQQAPDIRQPDRRGHATWGRRHWRSGSARSSMPR